MIADMKPMTIPKTMSVARKPSLNNDWKIVIVRSE